jgi:hypothetical protein
LIDLPIPLELFWFSMWLVENEKTLVRWWLMPEIEDWCDENTIVCTISPRFTDTHRIVTFADPADAALFKLRWL